jgi:hypothetical protein
MKTALLAMISLLTIGFSVIVATGGQKDNFFGFKKTIKLSRNNLEEYVVGRLQYPVPGKETDFTIWYLPDEAGVGASLNDESEIFRLNEEDKKITVEDFKKLNGRLIAAYIKSSISGKEGERCDARKITLIVLPE